MLPSLVSSFYHPTYSGPGIVGDLEFHARAEVLSRIEPVWAKASALGLHDFAGILLDITMRLAHGHDEQVRHRVD